MARLKNSYRRPEKSGWTFVHVEGTPAEIGFQHGYLLAPEIRDALKVTELELTHDNSKSWGFFRHAAHETLWPHIEQQYRDELQGIADGATARGVKVDVWDVVAMNATMEWSYYVHDYNQRNKIASPPSVTAPDHCSAFVATGSYTKDGRVVIGHNNWTQYLDGERWTIMFDIAPAHGYHFVMDGYPGLIHSGDDFGDQHGRHDRHRDDHFGISRLGLAGHSRVRSRAQGGAVFRIDRRLRADYEGREQRRLRQ